MTRIHNRFDLKERRRELRKNATLEEKILWSKVRNGQLVYKIRRQHSIGYYIADFYCSQKKLIIELDGGIHDTQREYDSERDARFNSQGFTVLRIPNEAIRNNIEAVVMKIKSMLEMTFSCQGEGA